METSHDPWHDVFVLGTRVQYVLAMMQVPGSTCQRHDNDAG